MTDDRSSLDERVYIVVGDDDRGDHHIFVTSDLARAGVRHAMMLDQFRNVKANWLESWEEQGQ